MNIRILSLLFLLLINTVTRPQPWQWAEKIGDAGADIGMCVKAGNDGTLYLTGLFESSATFGSTVLTGNGSYDMFFSKLDSSGNVLWAQQAGGMGADYGCAMIPDSIGNFYVMGAFEDSLTIGSYGFLSSGLRDMMVAKFDAANNVVWAKKIGGTGTEDPYSIQIDKWGNIYAVLAFEGVINLGTISLTATSGSDIALVKFDNNGNVIWAKKAGGMGADVPESVDVDRDGNIYIGGHFENSITLGPNVLNSDGDLDVFIAKCDSNGNIIWARHGGSSLTDIVNWNGMTIDNAGNIYVTGFYGNAATFGTISINGNYDVFVTKYDSSGSVVWVKSATGTGGIYSQDGYGITERNGAVYITGSFQTDISFNNSPFTLYATGSDDIYLAKIGNTLTSIEEGLSEKAIHVFPNPFKEMFTVAMNLSQYQKVELSILNSLGQEVFTSAESANDGGFFAKQYDLNKLESGVYLLQVKGDNTLLTRKIIKQ